MPRSQKRVTAWLSEKDQELLKTLCERWDVKESDVIRICMRACKDLHQHQLYSRNAQGNPIMRRY